jgi:long-chain acyl-CoA synthetase
MSGGVATGWPERCIALRHDKATVADLLDVSVAENPDKTAIIFEGSTTSYRELDEAANSVANSLIGMGLAPGDRVAVQIENRPAFVEIFFGIMRAGGVMVPANIMYTADEMRHILSDSGSAFLIVSEKVSNRLEDVVSVTDVSHVVEVGAQHLNSSLTYGGQIQKASTDRPDVVINPGNAAVLQYTSGTTGRPKGAVITHANTVTAIDTIASLPHYPIHENSVSLLCLPLFHTFGLNFGAGLTFAFGLTMVLVNRFDPELVFSLIEKHRVTLFWGVPPMYYAFVNTPGLDRYDVSTLENAMTGAAILPVVIIDRFKELTGIELCDGYGMSESTAILTSNAAGPVFKRASVGPPYPGIEISICDDAGHPMPVSEVGEICARGPNIFRGYWKNTEATREALGGGWLHTGDLGRMDEEGYVFIVGRTKDLIIVSGYNVYPIEVETRILEHPEVLDCAVVGLPDDYQGESVCAVVARRPGSKLDATEVQEHCRTSLAAFKCPKLVVFRSEIPKSASGKILKKTLREELIGTEVS